MFFLAIYFLTPDWLFSCNTMIFQIYFWCWHFRGLTVERSKHGLAVSLKKTLWWEKVFMSCLISSQFLLSSEVVENYCAVLFVPLGMNSLFAINQPKATCISVCLLWNHSNCYVELFLFSGYFSFFLCIVISRSNKNGCIVVSACKLILVNWKW